MKQIFLFTLTVLLTGTIQAQTKSEIFLSSKTGITYIGLDFSLAKMVGSEGFRDPEAIVDDYFDKWNGTILSEHDKYDLGKTFMKKSIDFNLDPVERVNRDVDFVDLVINKTPKKLTKEDIQRACNQYKFKEFETDIALAFIVESFDKVREKGTFHVVFVNTKNNNVIFTDKVTGEPSGFGLRNYWLGAFYDVIKTIQKKKFRTWKNDLIEENEEN